MGKYLLLALISLQILLSSCKNQHPSIAAISSGTITFNINYLCSEKDNPMISLLPTSMQVKFKNDNISLSTEGYLGLFSTRFISQATSPNSHFLLKVLNNKFDYQFPRQELAFIYEDNKEMKIEYSDSTKNIAGYSCNMAKVYLKKSPQTPITIFYTKEIQLKDPNRNTPFYQLKGVLLEFRVRMYGIDTHIQATEIKEGPIDDSEFIVPRDYKKVTRQEIQQFILDFT